MSQDPPAAEPLAPTWSEGQLARLEREWRQLQRAYAYHPFVEIVPLPGPLPDGLPVEYHVHYKVTTLAIDETGQLAYVSALPVHLWLPPHFPHTAPLVRPMAPAFHPNVTTEWIHLNPPWNQDASLVDVVTQVGFLLAFRSYDPDAVANPVAMNWAHANRHLLPTDPAADFSPTAGGEPLSRRARHGLATLRELQERVESACERMAAAESPPTQQELDELWRDAALTLPLFLEPDVPEHLRAAAAEVQELAASLREPDAVWPRIGAQMVIAAVVASAAAEVMKAEESLRRVLAAEAVAPAAALAVAPPRGAPGPRPADAGAAEAAHNAERVPAPAVIQPAALSLRRAVRDAEQAVADLRKGLTQLATAPRLPAAPAMPSTLVARRLSRELGRLAAAAEPARSSGASLASLEPVLQRARGEASAAERVAAWAEHVDLLRRGHDLVQRVVAAGPAGLQGFSADTPAGKAGPFDFEQLSDLGGGTTVAVWNQRSGAVRVVDPETEEVIARDDRTVTFTPRQRPGAGGSAPRTVTITVGEHTDDLRVQLDYLITHARDVLERLRPAGDEIPPAEGRATWPGRLAVELDEPGEQQHAEQEHRRAIEVWRQLLAELVTLGRFKQRLATWHLLTRLTDFAKRVAAERERHAAVISRADAQLAEIGARSGRDLETDNLIIPVQFASEYSQHLAQRDEAREHLRRLEAALAAGTERLRQRLGKPRLLGSAELPRLRVLPPLPRAYVDQHPNVSDDAIQVLVRQLEPLLGQSLSPEKSHPPETPDAV
jgi:hypothetical protein